MGFSLRHLLDDVLPGNQSGKPKPQQQQQGRPAPAVTPPPSRFQGGQQPAALSVAQPQQPRITFGAPNAPAFHIDGVTTAPQQNLRVGGTNIAPDPAARTAPAPAPKPADTRSLASKLYDQLNMGDGNRSFKQAAPTRDDSLIHQVTHNGITNGVGNAVVKPIGNTVMGDIVYPTDALIAGAMGDHTAEAIANQQAEQAQANSLPQLIAKPFAKTAIGLAYVPKAIYREVQNKPIDDIQQRVFGTTDSGDIGKEIAANFVQEALTVGAPAAGKLAEGAAAPTIAAIADSSPVASKLLNAGVDAAVGAPTGAAFNASATISDNPNATGKEIADSAKQGAVLGGVLGGAPRVLDAAADATPKIIQYAKENTTPVNNEIGAVGKNVKKTAPEPAPKPEQNLEQIAQADAKSRPNGKVNTKIEKIMNTQLDKRTPPHEFAVQALTEAKKLPPEDMASMLGSLNIADVNLGKKFYKMGVDPATKKITRTLIDPKLDPAKMTPQEIATAAGLKPAEVAAKTTGKPALSKTEHDRLIQRAEDDYIGEKISAAQLEKIRNNPEKYAEKYLGNKSKPTKVPAPVYDPATFKDSTDRLRKQIQNIHKKADIAHDADGNPTLVHSAENQAKLDKLHSRMDAYYASKHDYEGKAIVDKVKKSVAVKGANSPVNVDQYIKDQTKAQEAARGGTSGITKFKQELKTKFVDSLAPIEDTLNKATNNGKDLKPSQNLKMQLDRAIRGDTIGAQYVHDNGLAKVIQKVSNTDKFDQYLIAKHARDLEAKGITTGRDLKADAQLVKQYSGEFEPHAQAIKEYSHKLLDTAADYGLISKSLAKSLKTKYPNYVPLNRIFSEDELPTFKGNGSGNASISGQSVVKKIKGSTREIESPLSSLVDKTISVVKEGERNKAAQTLISYKDLPDNPFSLRELKKDEVVGSKPVVSMLDNGKVRRFETTKEIADAAKSLTKEQLGLVGKVLSVPTRVLRLGATSLNPAFALANVAKDTISAFINTEHSFRASALNPKVLAKASEAAFNHGSKAYQELVREGAGGTSFDIARDAPRQNVKLIRAEATRTSKVAYNVTHPAALFRAFEDTIGRSEEFTRATQYFGNKEAGLAKNMTEADATAYAANAARNNTVNFARAGDYGRVANSVLPYLNAGIQGSRTFLRTMKDRPVQTTAKLAATVFVPTVTVTAWNLSSQERKDAYNDIPDYEKQNNIIILPPHPVKDPKTGQWNAIKIPVSQEIANLNDIVRGGTEYAMKDGKMKPSDVVGNLIGTTTSLNAQSPRQLIGQVTPQAIKPGIESLTNQNLFTGNKIVPDSQKNLEPKDQYGDYTSGTAKEIGKVAGISPRHVDNFIRTTTGGLGQNIINLSDRALAASGQISPDEVHGKSFSASVKGRFSGAQGKDAYTIADEKAKEARKQLQSSPEYKALDPAGKSSALSRLQSDITKTYIPPKDGTDQKPLNTRQQSLMEGKPDTGYYASGAAKNSADGADAITQKEQDAFTSSKKKTMVKGDTTYFKKGDGTIGHKDTFSYDNGKKLADSSLRMSQAKSGEDFASYKDAALDQYIALQHKLRRLDPDTESSEYDSTQKSLDSLMTSLQKYVGYGGAFTKPKSGRAKAASSNGITYKMFSPTSYEKSLRSLLDAARVG